MMLANIIDGMPKKRNKETGPRTTLIVATNALVAQWYSEIVKHCKPRLLKVMTYAGRNKIQTSDIIGTLTGNDIVITSYDQVRRSYPKAECPIDIQTAAERQNWWDRYYNDQRGDLHRIDFLRVV